MVQGRSPSKHELCLNVDLIGTVLSRSARDAPRIGSKREVDLSGLQKDIFHQAPSTAKFHSLPDKVARPAGRILETGVHPWSLLVRQPPGAVLDEQGQAFFWSDHESIAGRDDVAALKRGEYSGGDQFEGTGAVESVQAATGIIESH